MQILLADDQKKVRSALRLLLEQQPDLEILGEAVDTTGLLDWVRAAHPDLVLLDWELPGLPAVALLPLLHFHKLGLRVVAPRGRRVCQQGRSAGSAGGRSRCLSQNRSAVRAGPAQPAVIQQAQRRKR
jgi:DNA-binding NarL/FixJ family response regulator